MALEHCSDRTLPHAAGSGVSVTASILPWSLPEGLVSLCLMSHQSVGVSLCLMEQGRLT